MTAPRVLVETELLERLVVDSFVAAATVGGALVESSERRALQTLVQESKRLGTVWEDRPP